MKIKLTRALWNHQKGQVMDLPEEKAEWAINRGLAKEAPKNAKVDFKAKSEEPEKNKADGPEKNK